jgi:pimeloyl-ACP methyl ester carboxylesterase
MARVIETRWIVPATLAGFLMLVGCRGPAETVTSAEPGATPVLEPCEVPGVEGVVECGRIEVWEDRSTRAGRRIPIHFVVARALGPEAARAPDPIFFFPGGPGAAATGAAPRFAVELGTIRWRRDLVFVDERGTGRSNPLDCSPVWTDLQSYLVDSIDGELMAGCRPELEARADLRQYTTVASAGDVDAVAEALGYRQINLYGASYGSRLALEVIRRHGERVRSALLVGVAPSFGMAVETLAADTQWALERLIDDCEADSGCAEAFPTFRRDVDAVLAEVRGGQAQGKGVTAVLEHPETGDEEEVTLPYGSFVSAVRLYLYGVELSAELPRLFRRAAEGDYRPIGRILIDFARFIEPTIYDGMWASVKCTEELPFIDRERARELAVGTMMGEYRLRAESEVCAVWPRGEVPADFHRPVSSELPVLMITGELDPASPPSLAAAAIEHFPNGLFIEPKNVSHFMQRGWEGCLDRIATRFLDAASMAGLDPSCAGEIERPPFVVPSGDEGDKLSP